ncbi:MAG: general secretion pathway protein GspK [Armatimonadetes bacterium]|nr:general secretion pathway protein GspK [Armatimonadota bacterium]
MNSAISSRTCDPPAAFRNRKGQALVMAIFVVAILTAGAVAFSQMVRTDLKAARSDLDTFRRQIAFRGGMRYAMAVLESDGSGTDSAKSGWARLGRDEKWLPLRDAFFRVQVRDASACLNINTATAEEMRRLGLEESVVDALIDWRDADDDPSPQGAESSYYESLPVPYRAKNGYFDTAEELLLVKGVTPDLLYRGVGLRRAEQAGQDGSLLDLLTPRSGEENVTADGKPRIDINKAAAWEMQEKSEGAVSEQAASAIEKYRREKGQFKTLGDLFKVTDIPQPEIIRLLDWLSLSDKPVLEGRVNINTASPEVLKAVLNIPEEALRAVLKRREENPFRSPGEAAELLNAAQPAQPGPQDEASAPQPNALDGLATKSAYFYIRLLVRAEGSQAVRGAWALVKRAQGRVKALQWREVDRSPGWGGWQWGPPEGKYPSETNRPGLPGMGG